MCRSRGVVPFFTPSRNTCAFFGIVSSWTTTSAGGAGAAALELAGASGFAHCQSGNTGCETNVRTDVTRCGSCTRNCNTTIRNANNVTCNAGTCAYTSCKPGFGNCDGVASNGCECACGNDGQPCCPNEFCNAPYKCLGPAGGKVCK